MASYNLVNGRPAHLSPLIDDELRHVDRPTTSWSSATRARRANLAGAQALPTPTTWPATPPRCKAGVDSFTEDDDRRRADHRAAQPRRCDRGLLTEADVDTAVRRMLAIRFRLGEFDPAGTNPYAAITDEVINCPAHQGWPARRPGSRSCCSRTSDGAAAARPAGPRGSRSSARSPTPLYEDWYSGTLPYAVTARQRPRRAARRGARSTFAEGVDRIALRAGRHGRTSARRDARTARRCARPTDGAKPMRPRVRPVRLGQRHPGALRAARERPVRDRRRRRRAGQRPAWPERLGGARDVPAADRRRRRDRRRCTSPAAATSRRRRRVAAGSGATAEEATGFVVEVRVAARRGGRARHGAADVAIVVRRQPPAGQRAGDRGPGRPGAAAGAGGAAAGRARDANPRTVLVVTSSYPYAIGWAQEHLPAILWSAHGGQEFGHALADVLFGDADARRAAAADLVPLRRRPARPARLRHHRRRTRPTCTSAASRSTRSATG